MESTARVECRLLVFAKAYPFALDCSTVCFWQASQQSSDDANPFAKQKKKKEREEVRVSHRKKEEEIINRSTNKSINRSV